MRSTNDAEVVDCPMCEGEGVIPDPLCSGFVNVKCPHCDGTGEIWIEEGFMENSEE